MVSKSFCIGNIGVFSVGKLRSIVCAIFGLIVGVIYALVVALISAIGVLSGSPFAAMGFALALAMIIFLPILYGLMGFVSGVVGATLYNLATSRVGGIKLETE